MKCDYREIKDKRQFEVVLALLQYLSSAVSCDLEIRKWKGETYSLKSIYFYAFSSEMEIDLLGFWNDPVAACISLICNIQV